MKLLYDEKKIKDHIVDQCIGLAIIIFIFGHIANFLFQVLGAFINALRLNYVEFFAQFFEEGKGKFDAFKAKRTFTKLKN